MNVRSMERVVLGAAAVLCLIIGSLSQGQFGPQKHEQKGPWENKSLSPDERADLVIGKMNAGREDPASAWTGLGGFVRATRIRTGDKSH